MSSPASLAEFIERVRAGDQDAAAELLRQYESTVRRVDRELGLDEVWDA